MAVRYKAVDQAVDQADDDNHAEAPDSASALSPLSQATNSTTMASSASSPPSPLPYVALAEQTFTPLSMDTSDFCPSDMAGDTKSLAALEPRRLLSTSKSMEHLRRNGNLSRSSSNSTAPAASAGVAGVSAMVQSFEALHASKTAATTLGYELLRTKSAGQHPAGLASPPETLSPSPSFSRPPSAQQVQVPDGPLNADSLGAAAADQKTPVAAQDENTTTTNTAPQTAAATPNPDPLAPVSNAPQAHNASSWAPSSPSSTLDSPPSAAADTTLIRPTPLSPSRRQQQQRSRAVSNPTRSLIAHSSSTASPSLSHPTPDPNKLSQAGNFLGNIAALEATAERLSMTSSIEEAIREEHNELKRSESRRSSVLRARAASTASVASRQNSILGINSAARTGGYSPGGFVMSPHHSMSATSGRLRSGSKASSIGMPSHIPEIADMAEHMADLEHAQEFRILPRHGPGKASTRSVASRVSLAQIAELEQPTALTQQAFDEADRAAAAAEQTPDDEEVIRATAHQFIEAEFADQVHTPQPMLGHAFPAEPGPRLQLHQPVDYQPYRPHRFDDDRPTTSGSATTFDQDQAVFGDFDGVHCDPDADSRLAHQPAPQPREQPRPQPRQPRASFAPRPATYFDQATGQQMLFYPAPVPAMLNLPQKLSKRPKAAAHNARRSQVVSALPKSHSESRVWLPDPTEGLRRSDDNAPFMGELLGGEGGTMSDATSSQPSGMAGETPERPPHARQPSEASTIHAPPEQREIRRPQRLTEGDNRTSRAMAVDGIPPQLRASAFFDLPPEVPRMAVKDGSAMHTLDSLLDASAAAPVSAFTDHVFAGKLGAEVYGAEKKRKKKAAAAATAAPVVAAAEEKAKRKTLVKRNSNGNLIEPGAAEKPKRKTLVKRNSSANLLDPHTEKKRASRFSLFGPKPADDKSDDDDDNRERLGSARRSMDEDDRSRGSASPDQLAPDADEESEEESDEEVPVYQGAPTTLLAELQLRKQQNKLRTRPVQHIYPDGMRSTLLELDAVAEVERKARHGKRIALAWEDPAAVQHQEEDEDDDVPLGMLYVAKAAGTANRSTMDISAIMSEVHRPLGLMERREMEENEPLSRRRDRLQGRTNEQPTSLTRLQNRMSHMPSTPGGGFGMAGMRSQSRLTLPLHTAGGSRAGSMLGSRPGSAAGGNQNPDESEPEVEGETLASRKARLAVENPLPRARPVSGAFSSELLREFGPDEENKAAANRPPHSRATSADTTAVNGGGNGQENDTPVPEEEETLGQRRRRLQREREAREREMAFSSLTRAATPLGIPQQQQPQQQQPQQQQQYLGMPTNNTTTIRPVNRGSTMSMADVLGAHPTTGHHSPLPMTMTMDPREQDRLRREAEAVRAQMEMDVKMAALRAQMPTSLTSPAVGGATGGYMGGRFNDGRLGGQVNGGLAYNSRYQGPPGLLGQQPQQQQQQQQRASTLLGAQGMAMVGQHGGSTPNLGVYGHGVAASMSVNALPHQPAAAPAYGMPMAGPPHADMVERWRQGVMP
ncbi:hypothetical protein C8A00DRAFT_31897 [Chaetomidium leptoderma]|uniref:Uncharacterized protein n=1 Tax=Chaetomidium leptoderma TaxID=669021 RepID=A0AAN6VQ68_9PEZI|nr:hypothetical protein C8A00DRAFT_31897 [Chaetomidium leptoderma]